MLEAAGRLRPDVAVVDLSLAQAGSLNWLRALRERCPGLSVIVLSVHDEPTVRQAALDAGADAFVLKRSIVTDLMPAVDLVRGGTGPPPGGTGDASSPAGRDGKGGLAR